MPESKTPTAARPSRPILGAAGTLPCRSCAEPGRGARRAGSRRAGPARTPSRRRTAAPMTTAPARGRRSTFPTARRRPAAGRRSCCCTGSRRQPPADERPRRGLGSPARATPSSPSTPAATGDSGGLVGIAGPREVADTRAVHDWLAARPDVRDTKIGAWGISYGGGAVFNSLVAGVPWAAVVPSRRGGISAGRWRRRGS